MEKPLQDAAPSAPRQLEPERVLDFLRERYGLEGPLRPLGGENHNFLVAAQSGDFVLKISAHGQSAADVEFELSMVEHLANGAFGLDLPRAVPSREGRAVELFAGDQPARLMRRVVGRPWFAVDHPPALFTDLGATVALLTTALADFSPHKPRQPHTWTLDRAAELAPEIAGLENRVHRRLLDRALGYYLAGAQPLLEQLPSSWIHYDVNNGNVLVDQDQIVGLVDFGDAAFGPTVGELAITVAYAMLDCPEPLAAGSAVVAGYLAHRELSAHERDALLPLVYARLLTSLGMSSRRRRLGFDQDNYFVTEKAAWDLLDQLETKGPAKARAQLMAEPRPNHAPKAQLLSSRRRHIGPSLSLAYEEPLHIVRGTGQYLWDASGRPYLDLVNNVCHVGHCHPHVVAAGQRQMATLNTNTRYLYDGLTEYAERLAATLPPPLDVCFFVTSGSEANELALRIARTHTGHRDLLVVEGAYHGHTTTLIDASPYKFLGRGGAGGAEPWVHVVPMPDGYRGPHRGSGRETGVAYGQEVARVITGLDRPIAGFILEPLLGCGGQIIPPPGYLETAFGHARKAGGLCIADEVQVGFGRPGDAFWAFETQGVVPDIVVLGKPIGNGHPMAAVVTRREIADSFANGMEFFSTFGGNPVSCAIGMAVLDVIESENLQEHARQLGGLFLAGLRELAGRHEVVGDVRGLGLFLGVELVHDRASMAPAADAATRIVDRMAAHGVLLSTDGPLHNVLKIKPPMVLTQNDVERTLRLLDDELTALGSAA